ncbi:MAG: alkaline phytoceramidase [Planctomycetia bacterium]|nr:alkaline phytoceramidase [Planctomycetia bacterium]
MAGVVAGLAGAGAVVLVLHGPIPQDLAYHGFADHRTIAGVANLLDVVSNLPFLLVALLAAPAVARWAREARPPAWARAAAWALVAGVGLTAVGSALYHLDPRNPTLVLDRLPMALTFGAFFALLLGDRLGDGVGRRAFVPSVALAVGSVVAWAATLGAPGADDLRLYAVAQFLPLLAGIVFLVGLPPPPPERRWLVTALAAYVAAKALETFDAPVFGATGGVVSGHTLKHLAAAVAAWALLRWVVATRRSAAA